MAVTIAIRRTGRPSLSSLGGIRVDFNIIGVNSGSSGFVFTGANGIAHFCYTGANEGLDSIIAMSGTVGDTAVFTWTNLCDGVITDDGDGCTADACDPLTGNVTHLSTGLTVTATADPILCYGESTCVMVTALGGISPYSGEGLFCYYPEGFYQFDVTDDSGCTASGSIQIIQPTKINLTTSSSPTPCGIAIGSVGVTATDGTPGYTYDWRDDANNQVGTNPTVSLLPAGTYTVTVTDANGCTATATSDVSSIGNNPAPPSAISGPPGVCKGMTFTYCVVPDPAITYYTWTLPTGATGTSTTNCITVSFSTKYTDGQICVVAHNSCGASTPVCKSASLLTAKPAKPSPITGPASVCAGTVNTYCVSPVPNAASYNWTLSSGQMTIISGQGTPCLVVNVPATATGHQDLKVKAQNCKGLSDDRKLVITVTPIPAMPGLITGPGSVCKSALGFYSIGSVANAVTYQWSITGNAWIAGGQGTTSLAVDYNPSTANSAVLSVTAGNTCGISAARTKNISINVNCKTSNGNAISTNDARTDMNVYPNPASGVVNIDFTSAIESECLFTLFDMAGKVVKQTTFKSVTGENHQLIDLSDIAKGAYLIRLSTSQNYSITQFFVE